MKTTDSVMRENEIELLEKTLEYIMAESSREPDGEKLWVKTSYELADLCRPIISHSLAEARREWVEEMRGKVEKLRRKEKYSKEHYSKDGSCDICHGNWEHLESCDYAIYRQTGYVVDSVLKLLTGDNPEEAK